MKNDEADYYGFKYNGKKKNLNHLLNFSVAPREFESYAGMGREVRINSKHKRWNTRKSTVRYNKEQFLQAK